MHFVIGFVAAMVVLGQVSTGPRSFGPGVCGPIDPVYVRTAAETGGQPFPMGPAEISKMALVLSESSRSDSTMILWAGGTTADADGGFVVPVDPTVKRVTFSITFDGKGGSAEVVAPDGTPIRPTAGSEDTVLSCGRILSIDAPASGAWRVTPKPTERFWLVIQARSDRDLQSAEFVRAGGRPGHEGLFRIHGQPIVGRRAMLRVRIGQPAGRTPEFVLLSSLGRQIQRIELDRIDDEEFVGEIDLPAVPFRVAITGADETGAMYQRVDKALLRAETVEIVPGNVDTIRAGQETSLSFTVKNHGPRARYRVTATVGAEILKRVEPPMVEIEEKGERRVTVWLPAAAISAAETSLELLIVASSDEPTQTSSNSAFQRLSIVKN